MLKRAPSFVLASNASST